MPTIKIDNKDYDTDKLSDEAKAQLISLQATDAEIQRLNIQLAIAGTARNAYAKALQELLSKSDAKKKEEIGVRVIIHASIVSRSLSSAWPKPFRRCF